MIRKLFQKNRTSGPGLLNGVFLIGALVFSIMAALLHHTDLVKDWENRFQTSFYLIRTHFANPKSVDLPLVLIQIDDHSLSPAMSRSPIDRAYLADLLNRISEKDPALIGFNILLDRRVEQESDQLLADAIESAKTVVLRDDPYHPVHPFFTKNALDSGTLLFKSDSSGTLQGVCGTFNSCRSQDLFYQKLIQHYQALGNSAESLSIPNQDWIKINFSTAHPDGNLQRSIVFPVIKGHAVGKLPRNSLKGKIVLIGVGGMDLYPSYRVPYGRPGQAISDTEVVGYLLAMVAANSYLRSISPCLTAAILLLLLSCIGWLILRKGALIGTFFSFAMISFWFLVSGGAFAFADIEICFILPALMIVLYTWGAVLTNALQERFYRLSTEIQLKQAKIDFLTNELHSHHLFNEFSRISVMIRQKPEQAREYLIEFADMLRLSLKYGDKIRVPLSVQLEYLEAYFAQQRLLLNDQIDFQVTVDQGCNHIMVAWHLFFPLVENAVKYSEGYLKQLTGKPVEVQIKLYVARNALYFITKNPYHPDIKVSSSKTGLRNLRERLSWLYPKGDFSLSVNGEDGIWEAKLKLPLLAEDFNSADSNGDFQEED